MFTKEQLLNIIPEPQKKKFVPAEQKKEKVIRNALQNYAAGCRREDVVAVYDTTVMGNGKNGYLLAADGLYGYDFATFKRHTDGVKKVPFKGLQSYYRFAESTIEKEKTHHLSEALYRFVYADGSSLVIYLSTVYGVAVVPVIEGFFKLIRSKNENESLCMPSNEETHLSDPDTDTVTEDAETVQMECEDLLPDRKPDTEEPDMKEPDTDEPDMEEPDTEEQCPEAQIRDEADEEAAADIKTDEIKEMGLSPKESMEQGRNLFFAGDYHKAAPFLGFAAEEGECDAWFLLGRMYAEGLGVKKNSKKAKELFDKLQAKYASGERCFISFGTYPQGWDGEKRSLGWRVLDCKDDELLLLSSLVIDAKGYHNSLTGITWENCDLRKWLNDEFLKQAFSEYEQDTLIQRHRLENPDNEDYRTYWGTWWGGNSTEDKVFLLSIQEAQKYFTTGTPKRQERAAATGSGVTDKEYFYRTNGDDAMVFGWPTDYAKEQGVDLSALPFSWWWLRSPGMNGRNAAYISGFLASICVHGHEVTKAEGGVRPVLWLKLKP